MEINVDKTLNHITNLTRHIDFVRNNCLLLGTRLIENGDIELGIKLIARGYKHDTSKFSGIEYKYLHNGLDTPEKELKLAIEHHQHTNDHHPEFYVNGIPDMDKEVIGEMIADWYARAQEFGTGLREWIGDKAVKKYNINKRGKQYKWIKEFVDILLQDSFKKDMQT